MGQIREHIISKEILYKNLRSSIMVSKENPFEGIDITSDLFVQNYDIPELVFAQNLNKLGGSFVYCDTVEDFQNEFSDLVKLKNWNKFKVDSKATNSLLHLNPQIFLYASESNGEEISIAQCEFLAARTGSILLSSAKSVDSLVWSYCKSLVIVASPSQVVNDLNEAYTQIKDKYFNNFPSIISVLSGPCKTSDIEMKTNFGIHGPLEVWVFLIENLYQ